MSPTIANTSPYAQKKRRGLSSCLIWALALLVFLLVGLTISWFYVIYPSIHALAKAEIDTALAREERNIPPSFFFLPGMTVSVHEQTLTEILVHNLESPSPIENPIIHINPNNVILDFQVYGFPCSVSAVPQVTNGHLLVTSTHIEGIIGLAISPDEIGTILNAHLTHAQEVFQHSVKSVQLKDQEMDLTF